MSKNNYDTHTHEVLDAEGGQYIEVFCHAAGPPYNVYQVSTHQPLLQGVHDRAPWRKIRAFKHGGGVVFLHPLNKCRILTNEEDSGDRVVVVEGVRV